jgi:hypothetical protein
MSRIKGNVRLRWKDILSDRSPSQTISEKNGNPKRLVFCVKWINCLGGGH